MNEQVVERKFYKTLHFRVIAMILVAAMVFSLTINAFAAVKIKRADEGQEVTAATLNYLVDNTPYVNLGRVERIFERLSLLRGQGGARFEIGNSFENSTEEQVAALRQELSEQYSLAGVEIAGENYEQALVHIDACLDFKQYGLDETLYADLLLKKACLLVMLERDEAAIAVLDQTIEELPTVADAYLVKAQIYADHDNIPALIETLTAYLILNPDDDQVRAILAQAQFANEDYAGANSQYSKLANGAGQNGSIAEAEYLYGLSNIQLGQFEKAESYLTSAIAKNDKQDGVYYYRGVCRMYSGDYEGAVADFTKSIEQNSLPQLCYYTRGVCGMMVEEYGYEAALDDVYKSLTYTDNDEITTTVRMQAQNFLNDLAAAEEQARLEAEQNSGTHFDPDSIADIEPGKASEIANQIMQDALNETEEGGKTNE